MIIRRSIYAGLLLVAPLLARPLLALDLPNGAEMTAQTQSAPADFARAPFDGFAVPMITAPGTLDLQAWRIAGDSQTNYQLITMLTNQLITEGYDILFQCQAVSCGGYDFRFAVGRFAPPDLFIDLGSYHYATLRKGDTYIGLLVSHGGADGFVQISQNNAQRKITTTAPAAHIPSATTDGLAATLEGQGHIVLDGVHFETGSATLGEGNIARLEELANYLTGNPDRRIALVGHTDAVGSLKGNTALSKKRAASVRARLIERYGISGDRLQAEGVGYLSPTSTNLTPEGQDANRRVEAVLLNTGP